VVFALLLTCGCGAPTDQPPTPERVAFPVDAPPREPGLGSVALTASFGVDCAVAGFAEVEVWIDGATLPRQPSASYAAVVPEGVYRCSATGNGFAFLEGNSKLKLRAEGLSPGWHRFVVRARSITGAEIATTSGGVLVEDGRELRLDVDLRPPALMVRLSWSFTELPPPTVSASIATLDGEGVAFASMSSDCGTSVLMGPIPPGSYRFDLRGSPALDTGEFRAEGTFVVVASEAMEVSAPLEFVPRE
jgi:hypothetical protein